MNSAFRNIRAIVKRELGGYFSSPVAYVFIVIFLLLTGFFTFMLGKFFENGQANLDSFFTWLPWLYLFLVPCVGMRLWAEERRVGTIELLLTKPITAWQAILGKFLASWIFLGLALLLTFPVAITVNYLGSPDNGLILAAYLGSFLMAGTYLAISCMTSAMTRNQVVSFIVSVVICLFLVLCGFPPVTNLLTRMDKPWLIDLVSSLSVMTHFQPFITGMVDSRDVIFFLLIIAFALFTNGVVVRSHRATSIDKLMKRNFETMLYSAGGVTAMFVVMMGVYIVTSTAKLRFDVTAEKAHTLSPGTKKILSKLDSRITLRFYCTQGDNAMPPVLRTYARRIEDLLAEYKQQAKGKLVIEKIDPRPDSEAEDSARLNGIEGQATGPFGSDKIYIGIAVSLLDAKFSLPFLPPERQRLLEYDISRAIAGVVTARPVVGIMSGLPVFGEAPDPLMRPGQHRAEDWAFIMELKRDFTLKNVPMNATKIDDDIKVLLVAHPVDISDAAQYAIDQFVLRGGKLLAFLDPHAYFDQKHDRSQNFVIGGDNAAKSSLDKLLKAWGLNMDVNLVAADTSFASRNLQTGDSMPTLLLVTREGIDENDVATSQIDNLVFPFAGVFTGKPADGLKEDVLVKCSANSELVDSLIATAASEKILRDFKPANVQYPLAVHLSGKFMTAFPDGAPHSSAGGASVPASQLKESSDKGEVVFVSDSDMLNDKVCIRVQNVMGRPTPQAANGNLNFVQSLVERLAGDDDLISSRARASMSRPFTRVKEMEVKAGKQWQEKIRVLETRQREMDQKIKELQAHNETGGSQSFILSPAQEKELEKYQKGLVEVSRDLKQVRKNLRRETDALEFWTKLINIGVMPIAVALSGLVLAVVKSRRRAPRASAEVPRPRTPSGRNTDIPVGHQPNNADILVGK
jgi:gliding motility-associatede transport system auxiliary component